jgi:hypothetical protein
MMPGLTTGGTKLSSGSSKWGREPNTFLVSIILLTTLYILLGWFVPEFTVEWLNSLVEKFVGVAWPVFLIIALFLVYVSAAWIVEVFEAAPPRNWILIRQALHWASEACPLLGLLTTFFSLLTALLVYGEAGPSTPETQAAFITQFAIAFGSSIAGGVLALLAFTLHRLTPEQNEGALQ